MVAFLTFLLGLTVGVQRIELAVDHRVASVELLLDGGRVALIQGEPWVAECDFGSALLPHHLEAVARDAEGKELDRALQRVNLPREGAEATFRLVGSEEGYTAAELAWRTVDDSDPEEINVAFDGEPIVIEGRRIALPRYDPRSVHILEAELVFAHEVRARIEVAFGGEYGEKVSTELTAVPLVLDARDELPSAEELGSWLRIGDGLARVVAVERGPREVLLVREDRSIVALRGLGRQASGGAPRRSQSAMQRMSAGLALKDTLRLVNTHPRMVQMKGGGVSAIFNVTPNLNSPTTGFGWTLTNVFFKPETASLEERLADAVGIAGLRAAASNRGRALVLVRSSDVAASTPPGGFAPEDVRRFLAALRVPFLYWMVGPARDDLGDAWGEPDPIRGWGGVHTAVASLLDGLGSQFVVWIEGLHKPDDVRLSPEAPPELHLAGAGESASAADTRPSRRASPGAAG